MDDGSTERPENELSHVTRNPDVFMYVRLSSYLITVTDLIHYISLVVVDSFI